MCIDYKPPSPSPPEANGAPSQPPNIPAPAPPAFWAVVRPSTFALLLLTISPLSILPHLPFPHLHNPLTLLTALLTFQSPNTAPARLHAFLLLLLCLSSQALPSLHPDASAHGVLHARVLWSASLGFLQHVFALCLVSALWAILLGVVLLFVVARYIVDQVYAGHAPDDVLNLPLVHWLSVSLPRLCNGEMPTRATLLLREVPFALACAVTAAVMEGGYATMIVRPGGRVAHFVSVTDIVAYGVAGGAGLAVAKVLLPGLWCSAERRTADAALRGSTEAAAWVVVTVATHAYVAVAVAERDVLGLGCGVLKAVGVVFAIRLVLALVGAADRVVRERRSDRRWAVDVVRGVVAAWFANVCYGRFVDALEAEAVKNVTV